MRYPDRTVVRADYERPEAAADLDKIDAARVQEYALLATLLPRAPDQALLSRIARLAGDTSPLGAADADVAEAARNADAADVERKYFALFTGFGRLRLRPVAIACCSRDISRRGSGGSLPIWSERSQRSSIARSPRSPESSSISRRRPSRCRSECGAK
jgi:hypothetical protein